MLEGKILVHIDGTDHPVGPRGVAVAHAAFPTPCSAEAFYRGASEPASPDAHPSDPVDFARVREAAERSGRCENETSPPG